MLIRTEDRTLWFHFDEIWFDFICFSLADNVDAHGLWNIFQSLYININFQIVKKEFIIDKKGEVPKLDLFLFKHEKIWPE